MEHHYFASEVFFSVTRGCLDVIYGYASFRPNFTAEINLDCCTHEAFQRNPVNRHTLRDKVIGGVHMGAGMNAKTHLRIGPTVNLMRVDRMER
jgi:hypothetical protein